MSKRSDRLIEKEKIIKKLLEYGLERKSIENLSTDKLRKTLHAIRSEMKSITKPVKIVIISGTDKDDCISIENSECSYCDTDDSECEYCDTEYSDSDDTDNSINLEEPE